jgi:hypothetical protein
MNRVTITYKDNKTLEMLKALAKFMEFSVSKSSSEESDVEIYNGVTLIKGKKIKETPDVSDIFSEKRINARQLRKQLWERKR